MRIARRQFYSRAGYIAAAASEVLAPVMRAVLMLRRRPVDRAAWRRGLILGPIHIGDVLCRSASVQALARATPDCHWDYLCDPVTPTLLAGLAPNLSALPWLVGGRTASRELRRKLRERRYDVAVCADTMFTRAPAWLAVRLGIPTRIGLGHKGYSGLLTTAVDAEVPQSVAAYVQTLCAAAAGVPPTWETTPRLVIPEAAAKAADGAWSRIGAARRGAVAVFVAKRGAGDVWTPEQFGACVAQLKAVHGLDCVLMGAASERERLADVARRAGTSPAVIAGELDLCGAAAFLKGCAAVLAPDTGGRHLGNAVGTPVVFFRNLTCDAVETGPYCANERDLIPGSEGMLTLAAERLRLAAVEPAAVADAVAAVCRRAGAGRRDGGVSSAF